MEGIKKIIIRYILVIIIVITYTVVLLCFPQTVNMLQELDFSGYIRSIILLPPIIFIVSFIDGWINKDRLVKYLGEESGMKGHIIAFAFGCLGVGPIYVAFPIVAMVFKKGATYMNSIIIIGAWSVGRIQQVMYEIPNMGIVYTLLRLMLNFVFILIISKYIDKTTNKHDKNFYDFTS